MKKPAARERWQYFFDNFMRRGTPALILGLFIVSAFIVLAAAAIVKLSGNAPQGLGFWDIAWMGLLRTLDSGTMGGDAGSALFLFMMLAVTMGGIFVVSALIGIINNALENKLDELRKGRSLVLESDHTVILGWSPQIFTVIAELIEANRNRKRGAAIVVLADRDKIEMEDAIADRIPDMKNTKVICRSGNPIDLTDLEIASPHSARSIIILPQGNDPDTYVIKTVLALTNNPNRRETPYHIVSQIQNPKNMAVVRMLGSRDHVLPILTNDLIARLVAQTSRQSGLSVVYTELMNFGGDEIYFADASVLAGRTYGEALFAGADCTIMGIRKIDGTLQMNPPGDTMLEAGDQVFALAEDDDRVHLARPGQLPILESEIRQKQESQQREPEKCLILGWNSSGSTIVRELDQYVPEGSAVTVVADLPGLEKRLQQESGKLVHQKVNFEQGDTTDRDLLENLGARDYDHVIVLAYHQLEPQEADAKTLVTLLHLRDIAEKDQTPFSIVSEMLDLRNRELAEAARVDDFIVSEHLVSLMTAQLSENRELFGVFGDIFDPEGSEIYLKPISDYVSLGIPVNFYTLIESARCRGETAIGYRLVGEAAHPGKSYGVHTNPPKAEQVTFSGRDKLIVIAAD